MDNFVRNKTFIIYFTNQARDSFELKLKNDCFIGMDT